MARRKFIKKIKATWILLIVALFAVVAFSACNNTGTHKGNIIGIDGGEFRIHFERGIFFQEGMTRLVNSKAELVELHDEYYNRTELPSDNYFVEHNETFFVTHQLIFVSFLGRPTDIAKYEVRRMEYQKNFLTIEFVTTRRIRTVPDVAETRTAIIEITRISNNLNVVFSHRDR